MGAKVSAKKAFVPKKRRGISFGLVITYPLISIKNISKNKHTPQVAEMKM